jgi:hypothetical protein
LTPRQIYIGSAVYPSSDVPGRVLHMPLMGAWTDRAEELGLSRSEKTPLSIVADREKMVVRCPDELRKISLGWWS